MEVYIEYVLLDNIVINSVILGLTTKILKTTTAAWRYLLSAFFGTAFAIFLPFIILPAPLLLFLKLLCGVIMILICFNLKKFREWFLAFLVFLTVTAAMGGMCFLILYIAGGSFNNAIMGTYELPVPMGLVFTALAAYCYLMWQMIEHFQKRKKLTNFIFAVRFIYDKKDIVASCFLDSGNSLTDPETNKPVTIINYGLFQQLFEVPLDKVLVGKVTDKDVKNSRYIQCGTISGASKILVFPINKMVIDSGAEKIERENVMLGLSFSKFKSALKCDALLSPYLF